jgi:hypothetical protein
MRKYIPNPTKDYWSYPKRTDFAWLYGASYSLEIFGGARDDESRLGGAEVAVLLQLGTRRRHGDPASRAGGQADAVTDSPVTGPECHCAGIPARTEWRACSWDIFDWHYSIAADHINRLMTGTPAGCSRIDRQRKLSLNWENVDNLAEVQARAWL